MPLLLTMSVDHKSVDVPYFSQMDVKTSCSIEHVSEQCVPETGAHSSTVVPLIAVVKPALPLLATF